MKPASFGTANIPISTPIPKAMNPWRKSTTGQPKAAKADNKPTTSTATKSASRERWPMTKESWFPSYKRKWKFWCFFPRCSPWRVGRGYWIWKIWRLARKLDERKTRGNL